MQVLSINILHDRRVINKSLYIVEYYSNEGTYKTVTFDPSNIKELNILYTTARS